MVFFLILIIGTGTAYDFKCPAQAEWRLRANVSCSLKHEYVCLLNLLEQKYQENCLGSDRSSIGSKLVFQPLFNLANCNAGRFQPIVFTTNGNSECIFFKSKCDEEGQVVYSNDSFSNNTACRCDYTKGYAFVSKPKNSCLCIPSEEDCSCFRAKCPKLSPDYQCITDGGIIAKTKCQEIHPHMLYSSHNQTDQYIQSKEQRYSNSQFVGIFILLFLAVFIVITVLTVIAFEYKERQIEKLKRNADEIHKIHEQILQGECGKLHFARLVFIGKNGVGKTSLMRRLLWHNKENVKSTLSTDGIEVEKCNINIKDGKWSQFDKIDDDLTRLIRQVYTEKTSSVERSAKENVDDQGKFGSNTDELSSVSDKGLFARSADNESSKTDDLIEIDISNSFTSENIDNSETKETDLNQIQPENIEIHNVYDNTNNSNENESYTVNADSINQLTSIIMKSYLKRREREQDDMLAFCWLWDFAGQKDFYATHQVFLSKCAVYLLVTDSLEFSTAEKPGIDFEDSAQYVSFWFDAIHCYQSTTEKNRLDPPIIVVCTNEDKIKESLERKKRQKDFKDNLGQVLKNQQKKGHLRNVYFVSNTDDADSVFEEIRKEISRQAMDMQDWGRDCPLKWLLFQQVLLNLKDSNVPISPTKTLMKIAKHDDIGIIEDAEVKQCLQYCHDIGTVVYFDEENLEDYVILDPKWLINAFRCLVSDNIDNVIEVSDDWQKLTDTGELTDSLVSRLFRKEPKLKFEDNKAHLLEVMKRFDIIVSLQNSMVLFMPCMMKSCSFSEVQKQFLDGGQSFHKTSWLCLEFKFLPPAFFNHILAWYIKQYSVSVIIDKKTRSIRNALYRHIGVFDLDSSGCEQIVVCEGPNIIALQVWDSGMSNKAYAGLGRKLFRFVETLKKRYSLHISYTNTFTCKDGEFTINRKPIEDLVTEYYRCLDHKMNHLSEDLVKPWGFMTELMHLRTYKYKTRISELAPSRRKNVRGGIEYIEAMEDVFRVEKRRGLQEELGRLQEVFQRMSQEETEIPEDELRRIEQQIRRIKEEELKLSKQSSE